MFLIGSIRWPTVKKRGRPYLYSPTVILRCFIVRIWFRLDSNNALHKFLKSDCSYNKRLVVACGLVSIPDRRTFDRRLKTISIDARQRIAFMGKLFITNKLVNPHVIAADSTLIKAKRGLVWHKSAMENSTKKKPPRSGIDKDARWGYSSNKGWLFGYKLHLAASTGSLIVPLAADYTQANVYDNQRYRDLVSVISEGILYVAADCGYDDRKLYNYSNSQGIHLVCPIKIQTHT